MGIEKYTSMKQQAPPVDPFEEQLRESLQRETLNSRSVRIARHGYGPSGIVGTILIIVLILFVLGRI